MINYRSNEIVDIILDLCNYYRAN